MFLLIWSQTQGRRRVWRQTLNARHGAQWYFLTRSPLVEKWWVIDVLFRVEAIPLPIRLEYRSTTVLWTGLSAIFSGLDLWKLSLGSNSNSEYWIVMYRKENCSISLIQHWCAWFLSLCFALDTRQFEEPIGPSKRFGATGQTVIRRPSPNPLFVSYTIVLRCSTCTPPKKHLLPSSSFRTYHLYSPVFGNLKNRPWIYRRKLKCVNKFGGLSLRTHWFQVTFGLALGKGSDKNDIHYSSQEIVALTPYPFSWRCLVRRRIYILTHFKHALHASVSDKLNVLAVNFARNTD